MINSIFSKILHAHLRGIFDSLTPETLENVIRDNPNGVDIIPPLPDYILGMANLEQASYWTDKALDFIAGEYPEHYEVLARSNGFRERQKEFVVERLRKAKRL